MEGAVESNDWPFTKDKVGVLAAMQYLEEAQHTTNMMSIFDIVDVANDLWDKSSKQRKGGS